MLIALMASDHVFDFHLVGACGCSDCDCQNARRTVASAEDKQLDQDNKGDAEKVSFSLCPRTQSTH